MRTILPRTKFRPHAALASLVGRKHIEFGKCSYCGSEWNVHIIAGTPYCQICREKFTSLGEGFNQSEEEE